MDVLNEQQCKRAVEVMNEYLSAPRGPEGKTPVEMSVELDQKRIKVIENDLKPLLADYLAGNVPLADFKSRVDGINKRNELWGFKGIKGQMFFNMVVNVADDAEECVDDDNDMCQLGAPTLAEARLNPLGAGHHV